MNAQAESLVRVQRSLPPTPQVARQARIALQPLARVLPDGQLDDVRLLVSELVTNSLRHARSGGVAPEDAIELRVECRVGNLYAEVTDGGSDFQPSTTGRRLEDGGLGLYLLGRIADRWGVRRTPGTCVWFEMDL